MRDDSTCKDIHGWASCLEAAYVLDLLLVGETPDLTD